MPWGEGLGKGAGKGFLYVSLGAHRIIGIRATNTGVVHQDIEMAETVAHVASVAAACRSAENSYLLRGDVLQALPRLERAVSIYQEAKRRQLIPVPVANLAVAYALTGRVAEALPLVDHTLQQSGPLERLTNSQVRSLVKLVERFVSP